MVVEAREHRLRRGADEDTALEVTTVSHDADMIARRERRRPVTTLRDGRIVEEISCTDMVPLRSLCVARATEEDDVRQIRRGGHQSKAAECIERPELGVLAAGKVADILVVDGDPLEDIRVMQKRDRLHLVMKAGKAFTNRLSS